MSAATCAIRKEIGTAEYSIQLSTQLCKEKSLRKPGVVSQIFGKFKISEV